MLETCNWRNASWIDIQAANAFLLSRMHNVRIDLSTHRPVPTSAILRHVGKTQDEEANSHIQAWNLIDCRRRRLTRFSRDLNLKRARFTYKRTVVPGNLDYLNYLTRSSTRVENSTRERFQADLENVGQDELRTRLDSTSTRGSSYRGLNTRCHESLSGLENTPADASTPLQSRVVNLR